MLRFKDVTLMAHVRPFHCWRTALFLVAIAAIAGCASDLEQDPPPSDRVRPVYDAQTGVIPLPNAAAVSDDGTLPRRDGAGRGSAQGEFYRWFSELRGWPVTTPVTIPFDGALDPDTVTSETVHLGRVADGDWESIPATVGYAELECGPGCASVVSIVPESPLSNGATYAVAVSSAITDASGKPIGEPVAFFYAASPEPLVDAEGNPTLSVFEDDPDSALALEGLRRTTAPFLAAAKGEFDAELALVYGWSTSEIPGVAFDPSDGRLPLPNDLALDPDRTFPRSALSFCGEEDPSSCAQGDFDSYLDGLHGWPTSTPISVPFVQIDDAPAIDPTTIDEESVQLWRLAGEDSERLEIEVAIGPDGLIVSPTEPVESSTSYALIVTRDVAFAVGDETAPLLPDPATALALQGNPVADFAPQLEACGEACGPGEVCFEGACSAVEAGCDECTSGQACVDDTCVTPVCAQSLVAEVSDCDAEQIEEARLALEPTVALIDEIAEVDYDDIAALSAWTTVTDTFIDFDIASGRLPFPNDLIRAGCDPERPICPLYDPNAMGPNGRLLNALSEREGFSTFATNFVPTSGPPLDTTTLEATTSVRFAHVPGVIPELLAADEFAVGYEAEHILIEFARPLQPETLSVGVITTEALGANGFPVQPSATFALIRNAHPLVDENGVSQVDVLDDATAQQLEPARAALEQLFDNAFVLGLTREEIAAAWPFTTGRTTRPLQELRARTHYLVDQAGGISATDDEGDVITSPTSLEDPNFPGVQVDFGSVASIHRSVAFETVYWVGPDGIVDDSQAVRADVGVTVYLPEDDDPQAGAGCEPPYNVAIVQHGLGGWRDQPAFALANSFASECIAVVAMDLPLHGGRTPGASLHPAEKPADSGASFLTEDIALTLQHYQQSVVDLSILARLIREGGFDSALGAPFSDATSKIGYVGVSLGGQVGTAFLSVEPSPVAGVINVAGANLALYLTESSAFAPLLDGLGVMPGTAEFLQTIHFLQWAADHVDPFTFASAVTGEPLEALGFDGSDYIVSPGSSKEVLVQMVEDDPVAPNTSTVLLASTLGVTLEATTFMNTEHSFLAFTDPAASDIAQASCARSQAVTFLSSAFAGNAEIPASLDAQTCVENF